MHNSTKGMGTEFVPAGIVRRVAEVVLGPLVIRRRMPAESGGVTLTVSGRVGGLRYLFKSADQWDPELLATARLLVRTGDVVWDVGSNVGVFSKAAAFHGGPEGQVIAFEADSDAMSLLRATCRRHSDAHAPITPVPIAVSDAVGFTRFAIARRARSANAIEGFGTTQTGGVAEIRIVPCMNLDVMLEYFPRPAVVKIDVEAAELRVLEGGNRMLREVRPIIHCEVASETSLEVTALLSHASYRLWSAADLARGTQEEIRFATDNTVAIPVERVDEVLSRS